MCTVPYCPGGRADAVNERSGRSPPAGRFGQRGSLHDLSRRNRAVCGAMTCPNVSLGGEDGMNDLIGTASPEPVGTAGPGTCRCGTRASGGVPGAAEGRFRGLLEAAPDAGVIVDGTGTIRLVNAQTEALFGYRREELLGNPVELLVPGRFRAHHTAHRNGYAHNRQVRQVRPMGAGLDLCGLRKDGTEFPVEISLSPTARPRTRRPGCLPHRHRHHRGDQRPQPPPAPAAPRRGGRGVRARFAPSPTTGAYGRRTR
nr:PAS domain S-box protein [Streptomyces capoamus]